MALDPESPKERECFALQELDPASPPICAGSKAASRATSPHGVILDPSVLIAAEPQLHGKLREWKLFFVFPMTLLSGFPPTAVMYPVGGKPLSNVIGNTKNKSEEHTSELQSP